MNGTEFHLTAIELIELPSAREANYRSAISRTYYSIFILIQSEILKRVSLATLKQAQLGKKLSHEFILSALIGSKIAQIETIGLATHRLLQRRRTADYDMSVQIEKSHAETELNNSTDIKSSIDAFGLPKLTAYLIQYIRDLAATRSGDAPR